LISLQTPPSVSPGSICQTSRHRGHTPQFYKTISIQGINLLLIPCLHLYWQSPPFCLECYNGHGAVG